MPENRPFTPYEDKLIKNFYEEQKITKWAIIARKLTEDYNFPRNAKQCRDRFISTYSDISNALIPSCNLNGLIKKSLNSLNYMIRLVTNGLLLLLSSKESILLFWIIGTIIVWKIISIRSWEKLWGSWIKW